MKIALACDHGAYDLKETIKAHLTEKGYEVKDFGCFDKTSCDYPDFAAPAAKAVASGECDMGVLTCTTGIGVSITARDRRHLARHRVFPRRAPPAPH